MAFIRIFNDFFNSDLIVSAKLTQVDGTVRDGEYERKAEFAVFTIYGSNEKVLGAFGGPEAKSPNTLAGLLAFNQFAAQGLRTRAAYFPTA